MFSCHVSGDYPSDEIVCYCVGNRKFNKITDWEKSSIRIIYFRVATTLVGVMQHSSYLTDGFKSVLIHSASIIS